MTAKITLQMREDHPRSFMANLPIQRLRTVFFLWWERRQRRQAHEQALAHLRSLPAYLREDVGIPIGEKPESELMTKCDASHEKHSLY